ncbi:hypothetical protein FQN54_001408 [Arachnomyces sp. PD_36]|nr:hypothetical protein FQN54_001408 [Arachnomyces sp. PD_36]
MAARIAKVLHGVHSIQDLTTDHISALQDTDVGRFAIPKFKVTPSEFSAWEASNNAQGCEYDAQSESLIIHADHCVLHENLKYEFSWWLAAVSREVEKRHGYQRFQSVTRPILATKLSGPFEHSTKYPNAVLRKARERYPTVVIEIGLSEPRGKLFQDANRWLQGTEGHTRVVIIAELQEIFPSGRSLVKGEPGTEFPYNFKEEDLDGIDGLELGLSRKIMKWHKEQNQPLTGDIVAHIYICRPAQRPRKVLRYNIYQDKPGESAYNSDQAFISMSELVNDPIQQQVENIDIAYESEDEQSYVGQKLGFNDDDKIPLPLDEVTARIVECLGIHREERARKRAKFILARFNSARKTEDGA